MNNSFGVILDRLIKENLHGPTLPSTNDPWVLVDDFNDLDSKDPRWFDLFLYFYVSDSNINDHDDLLFFVRAQPTSTQRSSDNAFAEADAIFVKRKVNNQLPTLSDIVCWKRTLFLNLIVQTSCVLTVSCCKKKEPDEADKILNLSSPKSPPNKTNMIALTRIIKRVYAAPYKSRMDVKDAFMNEISFPLIFYTVNDYESSDLHLKIHENEYLCVELSVLSLKDTSPSNIAHRPTSNTKPHISSPLSQSNSTHTLNPINTALPNNAPAPLSPIEKLSFITIEEDASPFPTPPGHDKVVLFKGAVPFVSLLEVFNQKSTPTLLASAFKSASAYLDTSNGSVNTNEYILMRGPEGKGQCQVAISRNEGEERGVVQSPDGVSSPNRSFGERMKLFGSLVMKGVGAGEEKPVTELECSMTYVNGYYEVCEYKESAEYMIRIMHFNTHFKLLNLI